MGKQHLYSIELEWEGNKGVGTSSYAEYGREHKISAMYKNNIIEGSSDPAFRGDREKYNPEELLLSSLASCHMLWYLHLCTARKIIVTAYHDKPSAKMLENEDGSGQFESVILRPEVKILKDENTEMAIKLHEKAHEMCFIARSCNFKIECQAQVNT